MPQSKRHGHERRPGRDRDREKEDGDDPGRHATIIERRWLGRPLPTLELCTRALRQWNALPGAMVRSATGMTITADSTVLIDTRPAPAEEERER